VTALLLTAVLLAACDKAGNASTEVDRSTPPSTGPTTVSTTESKDTKHTLAELVDGPCRVLSDEATASLDVALDNENDFNGKSCQWHLAAGAVDFRPVPAADLAADPANQQKMTATQVGGHPALLGVTRGGCIMYVAYGSGASFQLIESWPRGQQPAPDPCPLSPRFAAAIVDSLR
jgi:hypothetical protein